MSEPGGMSGPDSPDLTASDRVDRSRLAAAIDTADYLSARHDEAGDYVVDAHWGPEGEIYRGLSIWALIDAFRLVGRPAYLEACRRVLRRFEKRQRVSGGWTLSLGGIGEKFPLTAEERADSHRREDPVVAGVVLKAVADYQRVADTDEFEAMGERAWGYLLDLWDPARGTIHEDRNRHLAGLRSDPDTYHFLFLYGAASWTHADRAPEVVASLAEFVARTFDRFDGTTMPLMVGYHAAALMERSPEAYTEAVRDKLEDFLDQSAFASSDVPGGYGHRDGPRGIVTDELHMRSAAGLAIGLKAYDLRTGSRYFRNGQWYQNMATWIDSMKDHEGGYFEYQITADGSRHGKGSAGQYLPLLWILGTLSGTH